MLKYDSLCCQNRLLHQRLCLEDGPPLHPWAGPQGIPVARSQYVNSGPLRRGTSGLAPAETPSKWPPWGGHNPRVKLPRKAKRWPIRALKRTQRAPGPERAGEGGRERRHSIPRKAAGPTSGSLPRPPLAPPPPASTKPSPRRGPGLREATGTPRDRGPGDPRGSNRAGPGSPSRTLRTCLPALPSRRGKPDAAARALRLGIPVTREGPARPSLPRQPRPRWRPPAGSAWADRAAQGRGLAGACTRRRDMGESLRARGLSAPHRGANSGPPINSPHFRRALCSRT